MERTKPQCIGSNLLPEVRTVAHYESAGLPFDMATRLWNAEQRSDYRTCSGCRGVFKLRKDGTIRAHTDPGYLKSPHTLGRISHA